MNKILHINRNTINAYYNKIRAEILQHSLKKQEKELGEFELDKSYFGAHCAAKEGVEQPKKHRFWAVKKKCEGVCDGCYQLHARRANAHYSRENPRRFNNPHRRLESLRRVHS